MIKRLEIFRVNGHNCGIEWENTARCSISFHVELVCHAPAAGIVLRPGGEVVRKQAAYVKRSRACLQPRT
jgi:hypothetical protein